MSDNFEKEEDKLENVEKVVDGDVATEKEEKVENEKKNTKGKNRNTIIALLVAICAFLVVFTGFFMVNKYVLNSDSDVKEKNDSTSDETSGPTATIEITEEIKQELLKIASIRLSTQQANCGASKIFRNSNGTSDSLSLENKRRIVVDYLLLNGLNTTVDNTHAISENVYSEIANKYSFTDSFDAMFEGYNKQDDMYIIPPIDCITPEYLTHDVSFSVEGDVVVLVDNVTITNTFNGDTTNAKVSYDFGYLDSDNEPVFFLMKITSENK